MPEWGWAIVGVYALGAAITGTLFSLLDDRDLGYDPWFVTATFWTIFSVCWPVVGATLAAIALYDKVKEAVRA